VYGAKSDGGDVKLERTGVLSVDEVACGDVEDRSLTTCAFVGGSGTTAHPVRRAI